ncbi:hypothetical protein RDI58_011848 [Solanum bulbocastanum]|uniref:Uncharacterized protein n=1 Tax=Solanum bulbocastanum TaxID=147425 RepID=A0AAN8TW01_SOLBU
MLVLLYNHCWCSAHIETISSLPHLYYNIFVLVVLLE